METLPPLQPESRSSLPAVLAAGGLVLLGIGLWWALTGRGGGATKGLPPEFREVERLVRRSGDAGVLPELERRVRLGLAEAAAHPGAAVVVGRMRREDGGDSTAILAQMPVLAGGWYATVVKDPPRGLMFRAAGHQPFHLRALTGEGPLRWVGEHVLPVLPPEEAASVSGNVLLVQGMKTTRNADGTLTITMPFIHRWLAVPDGDPRTAIATLRMSVWPVNSLSNDFEPRPAWPEPWRLEVSSTGAFELGGLPEGRYELRVEAPGRVGVSRPMQLRPGRPLRLGALHLEPERTLVLSCLVSDTRDFRGQVPQQARFRSGERWVAGPVRQGWDLEFQQRRGLFSPGFSYGPVQGATLGEGPLEGFVEKAVFEARMGPLSKAPLKVGWTYLVHQQFQGRWLLFRVESVE